MGVIHLCINLKKVRWHIWYHHVKTFETKFFHQNFCDLTVFCMQNGEDGGEGGCECESCMERSALVAEMAEETKKLQQCWIQLKQVPTYLPSFG